MSASFPPPPIWTYQQLLPVLEEMHIEDPVAFPFELIAHIESTHTRLQWLQERVMYLLHESHGLAPIAPEFVEVVARMLREMEKLGVEGWVRWIEEYAAGLLDISENDGVGGLDVPETYLADVPLEGLSIGEEMKKEVEEEKEMFLHRGEEAEGEPSSALEQPTNTKKSDIPRESMRETTKSESSTDEDDLLPYSWFPLEDRRQLAKHKAERPRSPSTLAEVGSLMSGRVGRKRVPWTYSSPTLDSEYPPPLTSSVTNPRGDDPITAQRLDNLRWQREDGLRQTDQIQDDQQARRSPPRRNDDNWQHAGVWVHIPLPADFTIISRDTRLGSIRFSTPSSVFHFPYGATRDQLESLLRQLQNCSDITLPKLDPPEEVNVMRVRTKAIELQLKNSIARTLSSDAWEYFKPVFEHGGVWETEGKGDTYIVSGTDIHFSGTGVGEPVTQEDEDSNEATGRESGPETHKPELRGGGGVGVTHDHPSTTPSFNLDPEIDGAEPFSEESNGFYWVQEAYTLSIELHDLRYRYENLQQLFQGVKKDIELQGRMMKGVFRILGHWHDEARAAMEREEDLKIQLEEQKLENQVHEDTISELRASVKKSKWLGVEFQKVLRKNTNAEHLKEKCEPYIKGGSSSQHESSYLQGSIGTEILNDFKQWTSFPTVGLRGYDPSSSTTSQGASPEDLGFQQYGNSDALITAFYFFPSVSTVAVISDPMYYFEWQHPSVTTIDQIRQWLYHRQKNGVEDNPILARILEILEIRDEVRIPDPDTSDGRQVLIGLHPNYDESCSASEMKREATATWNLRDKSFKQDINGEAQHDADLSSANLLRCLCGETEIDFGVDTGFDSDEEVRYRDIGHLVNFLNGDITKSDRYVHRGDSPGTRVGYRAQEIDGVTHGVLNPRGDEFSSRRTLESATRPHPWSEFDYRDLPLPPDSIQEMFPTNGIQKQVPSANELEAFKHEKGQGCESWAGVLDPFRDRCTFCHLPFIELEPSAIGVSISSKWSSEDENTSKPTLDPIRLPSTNEGSSLRGGTALNHQTWSRSSSICSELQTDSGKPPYVSFRLRSSPSNWDMSASYPFKVCTNPYAVPPIVAPAPPPSPLSTPPNSLPTNSNLDHGIRGGGNKEENPTQFTDYCRRQVEEAPLDVASESIKSSKETAKPLGSGYRKQSKKSEKSRFDTLLEEILAQRQMVVCERDARLIREALETERSRTRVQELLAKLEREVERLEKLTGDLERKVEVYLEHQPEMSPVSPAWTADSNERWLCDTERPSSSPTLVADTAEWAEHWGSDNVDGTSDIMDYVKYLTTHEGKDSNLKPACMSFPEPVQRLASGAATYAPKNGAVSPPFADVIAARECSPTIGWNVRPKQSYPGKDQPTVEPVASNGSVSSPGRSVARAIEQLSRADCLSRGNFLVDKGRKKVVKAEGNWTSVPTEAGPSEVRDAGVQSQSEEYDGMIWGKHTHNGNGNWGSRSNGIRIA